MKITLTDSGKRFNRDWIFRHLSFEFSAGRAYAITGPNGSGKSTLLQVIAGSTVSSEGVVAYQKQLPSDNSVVDAADAYHFISISAPYLELIEEMTVTEFLHFHQNFKPLLTDVTVDKIIDTVGLRPAAKKQIRYYSSGMKQRVKLAQAIFSDTPVVLLDEPCTNLDLEGIALYQRLIDEHCSGRLVIVSSNDKQEYQFCREILDISKYK